MATAEVSTPTTPVMHETLEARGADELLIWLDRIGCAVERLSANTGGVPDFEIQALMEIQQYLIGQYRTETAAK